VHFFEATVFNPVTADLNEAGNNGNGCCDDGGNNDFRLIRAEPLTYRGVFCNDAGLVITDEKQDDGE